MAELPLIGQLLNYKSHSEKPGLSDFGRDFAETWTFFGETLQVWTFKGNTYKFYSGQNC